MRSAISSIFFVLLIVSLIALAVCLVKPSLLSTKKRLQSRITITFLFGGMALLSAIISTWAEPPKDSNNEQVQGGTTTENSSPVALSTQSAEKIADVKLKVSVTSDSSRKIKVSGETNLPKDTKLGITITGKSVNYTGQNSVQVKDGHFESETFSNKGNALEAGQYSVSVTMPVSSVQSQEVRDVIGQNGENLRGALVKQGSVGTTVSTELPFEFKADGTIVLQDNGQSVNAAMSEVSSVLNSLKQLQQLGREMEPLRNEAADATALAICGDLMRERQKALEELKQKAATLPQPFAMLLGAAASELTLCVSCVESASEDCDRATEYLNQAEAELAGS